MISIMIVLSARYVVVRCVERDISTLARHLHAYSTRCKTSERRYDGARAAGEVSRG